MSAIKICPKCGKENDHMFVRCVHCGTSLDGAAVVNVASASTSASENAAGNTSVNVSAKASTSSATSNRVAEAIKVIAILVYIGGALVGVSLAGYSMVGLLIGLVSGFFYGTMLLGFAEIIRLLHEINQKK